MSGTSQKRSSLLAATLWLSLLASSQSAAPATDHPHADAAEQGTEWPEFRYDVANSGHNPLESFVGSGNVDQLSLAWDRDLESFMTLGSSPALSGGILYVAAESPSNGHVFALDPQSGATSWVTTLPFAFSLSAPAVSDGILVVGAGSSDVYALDAATGDRKWTFDTGFGVFSSPTILNGVVYIGSNDEFLYALDLHNGEVVWQRNMGFASGPTSPAIADGVVYESTVFTHRVFALDAATGQKRWSRKLTGGYVGSGPVVDQGRVFVTTDRGFLYSLDASTGEVLWRIKGLGEDLRYPAVAEGVVYVGSSLNAMIAVDAATGALVWRTRIDGEAFSPIVANGVVYAGGRENKLYAFQAATGELLWTAPAGALVSNPILVDGRLYFGAFDNHLYAYGLPSATG
jgi:outer membrane protein assembly factor BamB